MPKVTGKKSYHHGDLPRAIIDAAEVELAEYGLHGFSLRRVSARVGVSHTAPAHHFGDVTGLINALAERGFQRLLDHMVQRQARALPEPYEQLIASGLGYLEFALGHPALFRLIFGLPKGPDPNKRVMAAADAALMHLARNVAALHGSEAFAHDGAMDEVLACWTRVHGFAELLIAGHVPLPPGDAAEIRETLFRRIFEAQFESLGRQK